MAESLICVRVGVGCFEITKRDRGFESRAEKGSPRKVSSEVERLGSKGGRAYTLAAPR